VDEIRPLPLPHTGRLKIRDMLIALSEADLDKELFLDVDAGVNDIRDVTLRLYDEKDFVRFKFSRQSGILQGE